MLRKYFRAIAKPVMLVLLYYAIIIWFCSFLWFTVSRDGDPSQLLISPGMPGEVRSQLSEIVEDYGSFLSNMLRWNFGRQLNPGMDFVLPELLWRMRWTAVLIGFSTATCVVIGAVIAVVTHILRPNRRRPVTLAHSLRGFIFSLTPFLALIPVYIFVLQLDMFPRAGTMSIGISPTPMGLNWHMDFLAHCFLPVLTLACVNAIRAVPIIWSSSSSLHSGSPWKIFLLSITTIDFKFVVSATIFVEIIFAFPGVGQWLVVSLTYNNHPVVIASFIALLTIVIGLGLISTLLDLLQIKTGIREALETPPLPHSELGEQHKKSTAKHGSANHFKKRRLIIGSAIVLFFVVLAITAPFITPYLPLSTLHRPPRLAERYAVPSWATIFPQYSDFNPTTSIICDPSEASVYEVDDPQNLLEANTDKVNINFTPTGSGLQEASLTLDFGTFNYTYQTPPSFQMLVSYNMTFKRTGVRVYFIIKNHTAHSSWRYFLHPDRAEMYIGQFIPPPEQYINISEVATTLKMDSYSSQVVTSLYNFSKLTAAPLDPAQLIFPEPGVYGIQVKFEFFTQYPFERAHAELYLERVVLTVWGEAHGVLGTNLLGNDVWTELVYGARTTIMFSFGLAAIAVILGLPFGILAGKFRGWTDNIVMMTTDTLLFIPVVPILLIHSRYTRAPLVEWLPILLFILPAITVIAFRNSYMTSLNNNRSERSKVCSLFKFSLANFFLTILSVSLILESIAFLGFGDPSLPSWGRMLYWAYQLGGMGAWWVWIAPVGFILLLAFGLFLVGSALDEDH